MGTYTASVNKLYEIIDKIADELIALPEWEEGDATWDTTVKTNYDAKRVVHHIADDIYLALVMENRKYQKSDTTYWTGLVIIISSAWDAGNHEPSGSVYGTIVGFEQDTANAIEADLALLEIYFRLFTYSEGFTLEGVPSIHTADNSQSNFRAIVERNTNKFYADTFTNFYIFVDGNLFQSDLYNYDCSYSYFTAARKFRYYKITRPFVFQHISSGIEYPLLARIMLSDSKVYYVKPIIHNDVDLKHPIFQAESYMDMTFDNYGFLDEDEIVEPGPSTKKFQVLLKQSPNSATYDYHIIMKAE